MTRLGVYFALVLGCLTIPRGLAATNVVPWRVENYTLTARSMPVRQALDTFGVAQGIPVVASDAVNGVVSGAFKDVPAGEFLDRIATINNLIWYFDGASLYVYGSGEVQTMLMDLKYMKADEVRVLLKELGVEDARFPIKTAAQGEMIMVSGPPRYVTLIGEMIARADKLREQRTFAEVETRIFPLRNSWADTVSISVSSSESTASIKGVAQLLDELMKGETGLKTRDASAGTNAVEGVSAQYRAMIRPENRLNAVVVRDVATRMPMYERLIRELDVPQKLVEIAVTTVEMTKQDALDWQLSLRVEGTHGKFDGAAGQNVQNLVSPAEIAGQGLAGAATYLGRNFQVEAAVSALKSKGKMRSISRTTLLTMNNFAAEMSDTQSYHARVVGENVASLQEVSAGTQLKLKPRIVPSASTNVPAQVWMTMQLQDGGFETTTVDAMPMARSSTVKTQTAMFEDDSIMIAGYMRDVDSKAGWGIPYLRDIPWIGWIFGGSSVNRETVQRLFILTPHVIDLDAEGLVRLQATRLRDIHFEDDVTEDLEKSDDERKLRDLERNDRRERREEKLNDHLERRTAELEHEKAKRQVGREAARERLEAEKKAWKQEVEDLKKSADAEKKN